MKSFLTFLLSFVFCFSIQAQTCTDELLNGQELRIDCGSPDCPDCFPLMYLGEYDETGQLEIFLTLPPYWFSQAELDEGIYYELVNGFNNVCAELGDCQPFLVLANDDNLVLDVYKKNLDGDILGFGRLIVESQCLSCQPASQSVEVCPAGIELERTVEKVEMDKGYMLKIEMLNGDPPYRVFDNKYGFYYEDGIDSLDFYLGLFPDTLDLDLLVYDFWGCKTTILISNEIDTTMTDTTAMDTTAMDTMIMDTSVLDAIETLTFQTNHISLKAKPTLFQNETWIELPFENLNPFVIKVISIDGKVVLLEKERDWSLIKEKTIHINANNLPSGLIYFLVETKSGAFVGKAVKKE